MSKPDQQRPCIVRPLGGARSVLHRSHSPWRDCGFWRIVHVVEGAGTYLWPGQDLDVRQSDYLVATPGRRRIRVSKPMRIAYLPFHLVRGQQRFAALAPATRFAGAGHERRNATWHGRRRGFEVNSRLWPRSTPFLDRLQSLRRPEKLHSGRTWLGLTRSAPAGSSPISESQGVHNSRLALQGMTPS